jgi:mannose-6-phosphate isomerase-like protein (cupin superfamily)
MARTPTLLNRSDWAQHDTLWHGHFQGIDIGANATVLFYATEVIGKGARLHTHPYDEIFIVRTGRAAFRVGDQEFEAEAGQVLFGPAELPHKFINLGPGLLEITSIHLNDRWLQTNVDEA